MAAWSLPGVMGTVEDVDVVPCQAGLTGASAKAGPTFVQRRKTFFPIEEVWTPTEKSAWFPLYKTGYLATLREETSFLDVAEVEQLKSELDVIFAHLQCLPRSTRPTGTKSNTVLWTANPGRGVQFVANSMYYRLEAIGKQHSAPLVKRRRIKASVQTINAYLLSYRGHITLERAEATLRQANRGSRRKPSQRKAKPTVNRSHGQQKQPRKGKQKTRQTKAKRGRKGTPSSDSADSSSESQEEIEMNDCDEEEEDRIESDNDEVDEEMDEEW